MKRKKRCRKASEVYPIQKKQIDRTHPCIAGCHLQHDVLIPYPTPRECRQTKKGVKKKKVKMKKKRDPKAQKISYADTSTEGYKRKCNFFVLFFSSEVVLPCGFFCLSVFSMRLCCGETKMPVKALDAFKKEKKKKVARNSKRSRLVFTSIGPATA